MTKFEQLSDTEKVDKCMEYAFLFCNDYICDYTCDWDEIDKQDIDLYDDRPNDIDEIKAAYKWLCSVMQEIKENPT